MGDWAHDVWWNAVAYAVVAALGLATLLGLYFQVPALRVHWLPLQRLRPGAWTGYDVFLALCIGLGLPDFLAETLLHMGFFTPLVGLAPASDAAASDRLVYALRCRSISSPMALALVLGVLFALMYVRSGSRPHHYGLSWSRWPANVALGIVAFIAAKPLIVAIFALALLIFPQPADILAAFGKFNPPAWEWGLFAFQTTVMAPLLEEILCRGILQGWLRRATLTGHLTFLSMTLFITVLFHADSLVKRDQASGEYTYNVAPTAFVVLLVAGYGFALYRMTRTFGMSEAEIQRWQPLPGVIPLGLSEVERGLARQEMERQQTARLQSWTNLNAWLAVLGSALFFAAIHPNWPAPLALFPMGLVLGWLAHRTQSLIGPITFHALFNLATFIAFYGSVLSPPAQNGNAQTTAVRPSVAGSSATSVPTSQLPLRR